MSFSANVFQCPFKRISRCGSRTKLVPGLVNSGEHPTKCCLRMFMAATTRGSLATSWMASVWFKPSVQVTSGLVSQQPFLSSIFFFGLRQKKVSICRFRFQEKLFFQDNIKSEQD